MDAINSDGAHKTLKENQYGDDGIDTDDEELAEGTYVC